MVVCNGWLVSFSPLGKTPVVGFQDDKGSYLTVGAGGLLKVKPKGAPTREELFTLETPSIQVRIWAFNKKFASNKRGEWCLYTGFNEVKMYWIKMYK